VSTVFYPRALHPGLLRDLDVYPVVALLGARQAGKSTLGREIAEARGMAFRTLDDRDVLRQALDDPEGLLDGLGGAGFIDEAQRAPGLFVAIKRVVDREQRAGRFLLSGSNQPHVAGAVGDSLQGRAAYRTLRPLTLGELRFDERPGAWGLPFEGAAADVIVALERRAESNGALDWRDVVEAGGFPRAVAAPPDARRRLLDDYVRTFAERDIRELLAVGSPDRFEQCVRLVAARTGQVLNVNGLAGELGTPVTTVRRWLDALRRSFLVEEIPAYSRNAGHRILKAPKLFVVDAALALAAAREPLPTGFHLETLVAGDLAVWKDAAPDRAVHHWRTQHGQEVDFVVERARRLVPVEVKASAGVGADDARHLRTFLDRHPEAVRGLLLSADPGIRPLGDRVIAAPWWAVL
jgi:predicted AAA+ superfamily ATPase